MKPHLFSQVAFVALAAFWTFSLVAADAQRIPCDDPHIMSSSGGTQDEQSEICIDEHSLDTAQLRALAQLEQRAKTLINEWNAAWPRRSTILEKRMRILRQEDARLSDSIDNEEPPPGTRFVLRDDETGDIDLIALHLARNRYWRLAVDAALASCPAAVKPLVKAAKSATGGIRTAGTSDDAATTDLEREAARTRQLCHKN